MSGMTGVVRAVVLMAVCSAITSCSKDERPAVQESWDKLNAAWAAKDGPASVVLLNQATIGYYEGLRQHALNSGPDEVAGLSYTDRLMVGMIRIKVQPTYLRQLDASQLIMVGLRDGWMDNSAGGGVLQLGTITVEGDKARADLIANGQTAPFQYAFTKEDGVWKHDQTVMLDWVNKMTSEAMSRAPGRSGGGVDPDQAILMALSMKAGKKVGPEIWEKPKP